MKSRIFITTSQVFFRIDQHIWISLEFLEFVLGTSSSGDLKCVELDGLRQRSAFTYGSNISNTDIPKMRKKRETTQNIKTCVKSLSNLQTKTLSQNENYENSFSFYFAKNFVKATILLNH